MFTLTIRTDNVAFDENPEEEIAHILQEVSRVVRSCICATSRGETSMRTRDRNGNTVGRWTYTREEN